MFHSVLQNESWEYTGTLEKSQHRDLTEGRALGKETGKTRTPHPGPMTW